MKKGIVRIIGRGHPKPMVPEAREQMAEIDYAKHLTASNYFQLKEYLGIRWHCREAEHFIVEMSGSDTRVHFWPSLRQIMILGVKSPGDHKDVVDILVEAKRTHES